jgi:hypothetical protein
MATAVLYASVCLSGNPVGGDKAWSNPSFAEGADGGSGIGADALLDATTTFSEELQASFAAFSSKSIQALQLRILKSYSPSGTGIAVTDAGVFMTVSGSAVSSDVSVVTDWPVFDYDTYGDTVSDPGTFWGVSATSIRNALRAGTLGFTIRGANNNSDIGSLDAFIYEFELTVVYTPNGAPQMTLMGVGM